MNLRLPACTLLLSLAWPVAAETVYRCADGYSQQPCAGGTPVQVGDERSAAQRTDSGAVARRDAKLAEQLQAARLTQEAQPPSAYIPAAKEAAPGKPLAKPRRKAAKKGDAEADLFTAGVPGSGKARKKVAPPKKDKAPA
jgi:hypothetical protein